MVVIWDRGSRVCGGANMSASGRGNVTLGDATVSQADLNLLEPPQWLNDTLLTFWCEHVQTGGGNHSDVQILQPNLTYFLALAEDAKDAVRELDLASKVNGVLTQKCGARD